MADGNGTPSPASGATLADQTGGSDDQRFRLAINILLYAFVGIGVITVVALLIIGLPLIVSPATTTPALAYQSIKDLFAIILPLLGTWVGTILAFYFSQRNFEAATASTIQLHQQFVSSEEKLKSFKVTDKMIRMDQVVAKLVIETGKTEADYPLTKLIQIMETADKVERQRLPILDDQGRVKYITHRSLIDKFRSQNIADPNVANLTLKDMIGAGDYLAVLTAWQVVPLTANLADAKHLIDADPRCSDVFVTQDGTRNGSAQGWVTNIDIEKNAQL